MTNADAPALGETGGHLLVSTQPDHLRVSGTGLWTAGYVDTHFARLENILVALRAPGAGVKVLVDLSRALVQPADTADRVAHWTARIYLPPDRVAIIVSSILAKAQMRRTAMIACREIFVSRDAALTWLLAHSDAA